MTPLILYGIFVNDVVNIIYDRIKYNESVLNSKSVLITLTAHSVFISLHGIFCIRSYEYLTAKCISAIPISPVYLLFLLPPIIVPLSASRLKNNLNSLKKIFKAINERKSDFSRVSPYLFCCSKAICECLDLVSKISHFRLLYLLRPAIATHPVLFGISLLSTIINIGHFVSVTMSKYTDTKKYL